MNNKKHKLEIINTFRTLSESEQNIIRKKLNHLLNFDGLISLCLESKELYIEFDPITFNIDVLKLVLSDIGFPLLDHVKMAKSQVFMEDIPVFSEN